MKYGAELYADFVADDDEKAVAFIKDLLARQSGLSIYSLVAYDGTPGEADYTGERFVADSEDFE